MFDIKETIIRDIISQRLTLSGKLSLNDSVITYDFDEDKDFLKKLFLTPFPKSTISYQFNHELSLEFNVVFKLLESFDNREIDIKKLSQSLVHYLKEVSKHPKIKEGDLFVVHIEDLIIDKTYYDAIGIYKFESKDKFIEFESDSTKIKNGIGLKKIDKACLVIFTDDQYTVLTIDNNSADTEYWMNDFLNVKVKNDHVFRTNEFLNMTRSYIVKELPKHADISKTEQIDLLNRSVSFFKTHEKFEKDVFLDEVFANSNFSEKFNDFETRNFGTEVPDYSSFEISQNIVKKQTRNFKRVLKLDKSIDIYIHGNQYPIEKGYDPQTGKKFYKIYYDVEE